jgi:hypothetical protein
MLYLVDTPSGCLVYLCRAGRRHFQVASVYKSVCVFIPVYRIQCRIKSLGPFKGRVSTLATHLTEITSFCLSSRPGAYLTFSLFWSRGIRLNALLFCAEIVNSTTMDSSICDCTVHNTLCCFLLIVACCAPYVIGRLMLAVT